MKELLEQFFVLALLLNKGDFTNQQLETKWIGNNPVIEESIISTENRLCVKLPKDYIEFLNISNGLMDVGTSTSVEFLQVEKIGYLKDLDNKLVEIWGENDKKYGKILAGSILVGGLNQEQQLLLIPPTKSNKEWKYWFFASWIPGEKELKSLEDYFSEEVEYLKKETINLEKPQPKPVIDFSLREAIYALDWQKTYEISEKFIREGKYYPYFGGQNNLYSIMLLCSYKLQKQNDFLIFIDEIKKSKPKQFINVLEKYKTATMNRVAFVHEIKYKFTPQKKPITLIEIENQIKSKRKDLLNIKNINSKISYQLYFLFEYGNLDGFISIYENTEQQTLFPKDHLRAAIVYKYINNISKAKNALKIYSEGFFGEVDAFEPYLDADLLEIIESK